MYEKVDSVFYICSPGHEKRGEEKMHGLFSVLTTSNPYGSMHYPLGD
jgi:hypothetical protein